MVHHVVCVIADHPTIVDLAGDLATDTRRRRRKGWLGLHVDAPMGAVLVEVLVLVLVVLPVVVIVG
jgi:hypothetical protein